MHELQCSYSASVLLRSALLLLFSYSAPVLLCSCSAHISLRSYSAPVLLRSKSAPVFLRSHSDPVLLRSYSAPVLLCSYSASVLLRSYSAPFLLCSDSATFLSISFLIISTDFIFHFIIHVFSPQEKRCQTEGRSLFIFESGEELFDAGRIHPIDGGQMPCSIENVCAHTMYSGTSI